MGQLLTCYRQTILKALVVYTAVGHTAFIHETKSVHTGSLSNFRPYDTIVMYKCVLENDEYASRHRLDFGRRLGGGRSRLTHGSCVLVVISTTKTGVDLYADRLICKYGIFPIPCALQMMERSNNNNCLSKTTQVSWRF